MIYRLQSEKEGRDIRVKLYKEDPVFIIGHKIMRGRGCALSPEEVFCSAENVVDFLLKSEITEKDFIDVEIDIFEQDCKDKEVSFQILTITLMKLCALSKVNPLAEDMAYIVTQRCQRYEDFQTILGELAKAEQKHIVDKGRVDLLKYELVTISKEQCSEEDAMWVLGEFINAILKCDYEVIKAAYTAFSVFNVKHENKYEKYGEMLLQGYLAKQDQANTRNKKVIVDYAMKLHPLYVSTQWQSLYNLLWNDILDITEVENSVYDKGKQKDTTFNRNLVANILRLMINKKIVTDNANNLALALEGNANSSIRGQLSKEPSSESLVHEVNYLIESYRKKIES